MPSLKGITRIALTCVFVGGLPTSTSRADEDLSQLIPSLISADFTLPGPPISHDPSVFTNNTRAAELAVGINGAIFSQLPAYPLGSSSGGFTYAFNPETGLLERNTKSFGPLFAERALTLGKSKWNVGWVYTSARYDSLDGISLGSGDLVFNYHHSGIVFDDHGVPNHADSPPKSDVIQTRLHLNVQIDSAILFVNYGIIKNFDLGIALPVVRTMIDATAQDTILYFGNAFSPGDCASNPPGNPVPAGQHCHQFAPNVNTQTVNKSDTKSGLGDAVIRLKYNFWSEGPGGLSLGADIRVPTGDEKNLLGTGVTATKLFFIGSTEYGSVSPHLNLGYTLISGSSTTAGDIPDETNYAFGVDYAPTRRFTLNADFVGRIMRNAQRVQSSTRLWSFVPANPTPGTPTTALLDESLPVRGTISTLDGAFGARVAIYQRLLLSGSLIVPLKQGEGIQDNSRIAVALEYSF
jgi:hypothetical protein